jgi:predicted Zn-ribbon and HTH transcriptional regulator/DNA-directed RNA polymerase subunit RPC12/RpoP
MNKIKANKYLVDFYPDLMLDWDSSKNFGRNKNLISIGSSKFLIDWKCYKCGFEWSQKAINRVKHNTKCKICNIESDSFSIKYPRLFQDWDHESNEGIDYRLLTSGSNKIINWKCHLCGFKWKQPLYVRVKLQSSCKICQVKENLFAIKYPELLQEWDFTKNRGIDPYQLTGGSNKKVWWNCKNCKNSYQAEIYRRVSLKSNCAKCRKRFKTKTPLSVTHPEILSEWDYDSNKKYDPTILTYGSNYKANWKCSKGHLYSLEIVEKTKGTKCPYCSGSILDRKNSLYYSRPEIAEEYDEENNELSSKDISFGSNKIVNWKCKNNHTFQASVYNRTKKNGTKCPYCVGRTSTTENSFAALHEDLLNEWDFIKNINTDPTLLRSGSSRKFWWRCKFNHSWLASLNSRTSKKYGCPFCSGNFTSKENSIGFLKPTYFDEWNWDKNINIDPYQISIGSDKKVWWKCKFNENHVWKTSVGHRGSNNPTGCPYCSSISLILKRYLQDNQLKITDKILLYKIVLFNKKECFLKIGITKHNVKIRYQKLRLNTNYKIVIVETKLGPIKDIIDQEQTTHKKTKRLLDNELLEYVPKQYFGGRSECYHMPKDLEYLVKILTLKYDKFDELNEIEKILAF